MKAQEALALARKLIVAFPDIAIRAEWIGETIELFAERMEPWDVDVTTRAVERLIDAMRTFPRIADLRDAYAAEGGSLPDSGRNMSPVARPLPPEPDAATREQIRQFGRRVRERIVEQRGASEAIGRLQQEDAG